MSLYNGIRVQWRVIHALIMRETTTRYGNSKIGFLWAFLEPLIHIATFIYIFSMIGRATPIGDNTALFILTGIIPWLLFNHIVFQVMSGLGSNQALLSYPHVMPLDIALARTILEFVTLGLIFVVFLVLAKQIGIEFVVEDAMGMLAAIATLVVFALGLGLLNTSIALYLPSYDRMFRNAMRPMYFMSGIFFIADGLPPAAQQVLQYNPILHLVEWFRSEFYDSYESQQADLPYVLSITILIFFFGLLSERLTKKRARQA